MNDPYIDQAFILAAGFAKRMRPLTDYLPKPLVQLGGQPLLSHIIDKLAAVHVKKIVINGHHCVDKLNEYMPKIQKEYPDIELILSVENDILETGGGTIQALQHLNQHKPFYMINGDTYWVDALDENTLETLNNIWHAKQNANMVMMLQDINRMPFGKTVGDYVIHDDGTATRALDRNGTHMFMGLRILHPHLMDDYKQINFSFLLAMDKAQSQGTLFGYNHKGDWYHISTPQDLEAANQLLFEKTA
jgi:MurNAc alpha-1-phosphate uridylyltransferase